MRMPRAKKRIDENGQVWMVRTWPAQETPASIQRRVADRAETYERYKPSFPRPDRCAR